MLPRILARVPARVLALDPREPVSIAKWLLILFAAGVLAFNLWHADAPDVAVLSLALLPWIAGPAALAALLVARATSRPAAWAFVAAEVAIVASTIAVWIILIVVKPDAQNGIAMILFPLYQFAALLVCAVGVFAVSLFMRRKRSTLS